MIQAPLFIHLTLSLKTHKPCTDGCQPSQTISSNCVMANLNSLQFNNQKALELCSKRSPGKKERWCVRDDVPRAAQARGNLTTSNCYSSNIHEQLLGAALGGNKIIVLRKHKCYFFLECLTQDSSSR